MTTGFNLQEMDFTLAFKGFIRWFAPETVLFDSAEDTTIAALAYAVKRYAPLKNGDSQEPPQRFTNENITASFVAAIPTITRELNLEVATATQTETFTQSSSKTLLWGLVDLGDPDSKVWPETEGI